MKKKLELFLIGIIILASTTGCMKVNSNITINKDKSMDISVVSAVADQLVTMMQSESGQSSNPFEISDDDKKKASESGYEIKEYKEGGYTGITLNKHINNIDDVSTAKKINAKLDSIDTSGNTKQGSDYLFTVRKGLFKNTYEASFDTSSEKDTVSSAKEYEDMDSSEMEAYKALMSSMEVKFNVTLPNKAISSNATDVSSDGKTLTWDFLKNSNINKVEFSFSLVNTANVIIAISLVAIVLISIVIIVIHLIRNKGKGDKNKKESKDGDIKIIIDEKPTSNDNISVDPLMQAQVVETQNEQNKISSENNNIKITPDTSVQVSQRDVNNEKSFFDMYKPVDNPNQNNNENSN